MADTILAAGLSHYYRERSALPKGPAELVPEALIGLRRFDLPGVREQFVAPSSEGADETTLTLDGLSCAACAWLVEQRLRTLPGVLQAEVNYATHRMHVAWKAEAVTLSAILAAIAGVGLTGYPTNAISNAAPADALPAAARRRALWEIFVAGFAMMQLMMYTVPMYLADPGEVTADIRQLMQWASFILTVPVMVFSARPIFRAAWSAISVGAVAMDVPIALAILLAFATSTWALLSGTDEVYFDSIAMFVLLLLSARFIDAEMRRRRLDDLESIAPPIPAVAELIAGFPLDRGSREVACASLKPGDIVRIATGATVPADAEIIDGPAAGGQCDEALLSGESRPVDKRIGDTLIGGSINIGSPLYARVSAVGAATILSGLVRASETALASRPALEKQLAVAASHLSSATIILAGAAAFFWLAVDSSRAFEITVAMLAITCPCALALAIPAATAAAAGAMARAGVIVRNGRWFETLPAVTDVVLDKTGTLTTGEMRVMQISAADLTENECLAVAAALEGGSHHPIARVLRREAERRELVLPVVTGISAGSDGICGQYDGADWFLGASQPGDLQPDVECGSVTVVVLRRDGHCCAAVALQDELREDAAAFVETLRNRDIDVHLLSGDHRSPVAHCANVLGLSDWQARMTPDQKRAYVQNLQAAGAVVLALGDGVNDAPLLAQADAGIAIAQGAALARARADAILVSRKLIPVATALQVGQKARAVIRQNLAWAFAYNLVCLPLAAFGLASPFLAAIGMSSSSLLVIANAARISRPSGMSRVSR